MPELGPLDASRVRPLSRAERKRVEETVTFCADVLDDGWEATVSDRAVACLTPRTWARLFSRRRTKDCKALADLAKAILAGKQKLHDLIGWFAAWLVKYFGGSDVERVVARELSKRIPLPAIDDHAAVVARGLQMLGILLCLSRGDPLTQCQSFVDLSLQETKEKVKQVLGAALDDWTNPPPRMVNTWAGPGAAGHLSG